MNKILKIAGEVAIYFVNVAAHVTVFIILFPLIGWFMGKFSTPYWVWATALLNGR